MNCRGWDPISSDDAEECREVVVVVIPPFTVAVIGEGRILFNQKSFVF